MTLQEQRDSTSKEIDLAYATIDNLKKAWAEKVASFLYPQDPGKIRVSVEYHSDWEGSSGISLSLKLGGYAWVDLKPEGRFQFSTTGYAYDSSREGILDIVKEAGHMHNLLAAIVSSDTIYTRICDEYTSMVISNEEYIEARQKLELLHKKLSGINSQIEEERRIAKESLTNSLRVQGLLLKSKHTYGSRLVLGLVTQVTPTKIRIYMDSYYPETGESQEDLFKRAILHMNSVKGVALIHKYGDFYKNGVLADDFEIAVQ